MAATCRRRAQLLVTTRYGTTSLGRRCCLLGLCYIQWLALLLHLQHGDGDWHIINLPLPDWYDKQATPKSGQQLSFQLHDRALHATGVPGG